jgi:uncharacterized membrane protein YbaN (DUF454 family)
MHDTNQPPTRSQTEFGNDIADFADAAPARELSVVHSSFGRLRVHLPHWSGTRGEDIIAGVRRLPGVTHAEARSITGNVLILFEPQQTSAAALIESLPALRLDPLPLTPTPLPVGERGRGEGPEQINQLAVVNQGPAAQEAEAGDYLTGWRRVLYQALGWSSVGMAVVGAIMPGIPTAPFVVLAGYFFIRSSREAHQWLRQSRWFGTILRDWEEHRGIRRSLRNAALALIGVSMVLTSLMGLPNALLASILALQVAGLAVVLSLRVVEAPALSTSAASVN